MKKINYFNLKSFKKNFENKMRQKNFDFEIDCLNTFKKGRK